MLSVLTAILRKLARKICICGKVGGVAGLFAWIFGALLVMRGADFWLSVLGLSILLIFLMEILFLVIVRVRAPLLPFTIALTVVTTVIVILAVLRLEPLLGAVPILGVFIGVIVGEVLCRFLSLGFRRYDPSM